jgi:hypothetical protein
MPVGLHKNFYRRLPWGCAKDSANAEGVSQERLFFQRYSLSSVSLEETVRCCSHKTPFRGEYLSTGGETSFWGNRILKKSPSMKRQVIRSGIRAEFSWMNPSTLHECGSMTQTVVFSDSNYQTL